MPTPSNTPKRWLVGLAVASTALIVFIIYIVVQSTIPMMGWSSSSLPVAPSAGVMMYRGAPSQVGYAEGDIAYDKASIMPPVPMPGGATAEDRARVGEKIIRTGSLTMRVDDAAKRMQELRDLTEKAGGFVASANLTDNAGVKTAYATIRVPNDKFRDVVNQAKALATTVFDESESGQDVTAQYVDLDARLTAAKAEEQQYMDILKKAGTIEDTLAVTARLADVRSRIEQLQGQMRLLSDQTTYATLSVTLTEEAKVVAPTRVWKPYETLKLALRGLVESLQSLADTLITGGVFILGLLVPILLVLWLVVWIVLKAVKRMTKK